MADITEDELKAQIKKIKLSLADPTSISIDGAISTRFSVKDKERALALLEVELAELTGIDGTNSSILITGYD